MASLSHEDEGLESEAKRRRLRKGTHSCWACKRRKVRCTFASETDAICMTCHRRGTKCISQELPEDLEQVESSADRIVRVEAQLNQLARKVDHGAAKDGAQSATEDGRRPQGEVPTPTSDFGPSSRSLHGHTQERFPRRGGDADTRTRHSTPALRTPDSQAPPASLAARPDTGNGKYKKISQDLLAALPSPEDLSILLKLDNSPSVLCHQINVKSRSQLDREGFQDDFKLKELIHTPDPHPVLLAKQMLLFSTILLYQPVHKDLHGLSEDHLVIMDRIADTAINLVTTREDLLGTMESLECILLEAFYHLDNGNVRRAWLAFRRAMVAAQLMGINRPYNSPVKIIDPSTDIDPQLMWFRIVYMDRFLSLLLGLPPGNSNVNLRPETIPLDSAPSEQLERLHTVILAKILERNELGPSQRAIDMTVEIDTELLKAAEALPAKFWRPPNFADLEQDSPEAIWETLRVKDQIFHHTMLNQLHLPFLLCPGSDQKNKYARITCVNSSREILTQFVVFRNFHRVMACCRLADFLALVAGMTLILAHLYSYPNKETDNLLAHQRLGDRATVEQALESMALRSKLNEDMLAARCATLLQHLLDVEADAAKGQNYSTQKVQYSGSCHEDERTVLVITVPYIGTIRIAREGISSMDILRMPPRNAEDLGENITIGGIGSVRIANPIPPSDTGQPSPNDPADLGDRFDFGILSPLAHQQPVQTQNTELHPVLGTGQPSDTAVGDGSMPQQDLYPSVAAGMNDWYFQGVDTAFFDNLMRGTSVQAGDGGADWIQTWANDLSMS
jgi:hypothetical protein